MRSEHVTIHLGLYGRTATKTVKLLFAGLREHLHYQETNTLLIGRNFTGRQTNVVVGETGEVMLLVNPSSITGCWRKYNLDSLKFSAYAKDFDIEFIKSWLAADLRLRVNDMQCSDILQLHPKSKTSQTSKAWEIYATADALCGATSDDLDVKYGKGTGDKVIGSELDPVKIEVNSVILEEADRIKQTFREKQKNLRFELECRISQLRINYKKDLIELGKQERAAISQMKKEMLSM